MRVLRVSDAEFTACGEMQHQILETWPCGVDMTSDTSFPEDLVTDMFAFSRRGDAQLGIVTESYGHSQKVQ